MARLLVVEDEEVLAAAIGQGLEEAGHKVRLVHDGETAVWELDARTADLVVLDVMIPGITGLEVCRRVRERHDPIPIIMLTARDTTQDIVAGLDAGADDYLVKPFAFEELLARVRSLLRRGAGQTEAAALSVGALLLDTEAHVVEVDGEATGLTRQEFAILEFLARRPGAVVTKARLMEVGWDDEDVSPNVLEVHISNLRRKLDASDSRRFIQTRRGVGYVLVDGSS